MATKKLVSLLVVFCMLATIFTACAPKAPTAPAEPAAPASTAAPAGSEAAAGGEKTPVTIEAFIVQPDWIEAWDDMEAKFEKEYPWIDVVSVGTGESAGTTSEYIISRVASGVIPDMLQVDNNEVCRSLVDEGLLRDLSDREGAKHIPDSYKDSFTYNGNLFGYTQGAAFSVLYLNMSILNEAGWTEAPANWDEFIQCCADIQTKTGIAPLTLAGDKSTTCWMLYESILANVCGDELGMGVFEQQFMDGTFDFSAYPKATERLAQVAPYMLTGSATYVEDDVTAAMADGSAAMALGGNWTANNICSAIESAAGSADAVKAMLAPFNDAGKDAWISVSPETAFGMSNQNDDPNKVEAREIFFDWVFQPENFKFIQNARGTVPVLDNMTADQIVLPSAVSEIVPAMNAAKFVKMGFNLWTQVFSDAACTALKDVYSGNKTAEDAVKIMTDTVKTSFVNQK